MSSNPSSETGFDLSKARLVELALTDVSGVGPGRSPSPEQRKHAGLLLSSLAASLSTQGILRWRLARRELTLTAGVGTYTLPQDVWDIDEPVNYRDSATDTTRRPLWALSMEDYRVLSNREVQSTPSQYMIEKVITTDGEVAKLTTFPFPSISGSVIEYPAILKVRDYKTDANTGDFPAKWLRCLRYGLALDLCAPYKVPGERVAFLKGEFEQAKQDCLADDHERVPLQVVPFGSYGYYGGGGNWYT